MIFAKDAYSDQMYSDVLVEEIESGSTFTLCAFRDPVFAERSLVKGCVFERCVFVSPTCKNVAQEVTGAVFEEV